VLQHLCVLIAQPVVPRQREAKLAAEAPQEVGAAAELGGHALVRRGGLDRLGQEAPKRKGKLTRGNAPRDVLQRNPGILKRRHEANDMDVGGRETSAPICLEQAELRQPMHPLG